MGEDNDRRGVQYTVGKEGLWPATHAERVDEQITALTQRLTTLESTHQALRQAVIAQASTVDTMLIIMEAMASIMEKESPL
jgi:hypothetical protein